MEKKTQPAVVWSRILTVSLPLQVDGCLLEPLPPVVAREASSLLPSTSTESSIDEGIEAEEEQIVGFGQSTHVPSEGVHQPGTVPSSSVIKNISHPYSLIMRNQC